MLSARTSIDLRHQLRAPLHIALEPTHALVAGDSETELRFIRDVLEAARYQVLTTRAGMELTSDLRRRVGGVFSSKPVELVVVQSVHESAVAASLLGAIREVYPVLPIILIQGGDAELRREAERLGVDVILNGPPVAAELRRAALELSPSAPEVEADWRF